MAERRLVVDNMKFTYSGLLEMEQFYHLIDRFLREKGYDKREMVNQEHVRPDGKYVELVLQPWKKISDYIRHVIKIRIRVLRLKEVVVELDGHKTKMQEGNVTVTMSGYLETDYEGRWEQKPFYFFLRTMFDKFFFRTPNKEAEDLLVESVAQLHGNMKAFLNLYQHRFGVMQRPSIHAL